MQVRKLELEVQEKAKDNARLSEQWDQQRAQQQDDAHTQLEERDQQRELLQQLHHHEKSARQWQGMFDSVSGVLEQERRQRAANDANVSDQLRRSHALFHTHARSHVHQIAQWRRCSRLPSNSHWTRDHDVF